MQEKRKLRSEYRHSLHSSV